MSILEKAMEAHAAADPGRIALDDGAGRMVTRRELVHLIRVRVRVFRGLGVATLGIYADNGIDWILADLAAHVAGIPTVPLPKFFTPSQLDHVARTAAIDGIVTDDLEAVSELGFEPGVELTGNEIWIARRDVRTGPSVPFQKVTFTSGTTGAPKGVCLGRDHLETVTTELMKASVSLESDIHVCCLPLSILLENIAGVHRSLLRGARVVVPPLAAVGLVGAQQFDPARALRGIRDAGATSAILVPEMLKGLVAFSRGNAATRLRSVGVGGARVAPSLLEAANACGLPAYEGYGLSEFGSVVALNTPDASRIGTAGRPLPHVEFRISAGDEIQIRGPHFLGYLTDHGFVAPATTDDGFFPTGDLGTLDDDGFVQVTGRSRNVLITSFGRNVSPEWVESEILEHPLVAQALVFGEGARSLSAVVVARGDGSGIEAHIAAVNQRLPDYARIGRCTVTQTPFSQRDGLAQASGSPIRAAVERHFAVDAARSGLEGEQGTWAFTIAS